MFKNLTLLKINNLPCLDRKQGIRLIWTSSILFIVYSKTFTRVSLTVCVTWNSGENALLYPLMSPCRSHFWLLWLLFVTSVFQSSSNKFLLSSEMMWKKIGRSFDSERSSGKYDCMSHSNSSLGRCLVVDMCCGIWVVAGHQ